MRFFPWVDFQFWTIALFLGLLAAVLAYLSWGVHPYRKEAPVEKPLEVHPHNPIPPLLIFVYTVIVAWAISYVFYVYTTGYDF